MNGDGAVGVVLDGGPAFVDQRAVGGRREKGGDSGAPRPQKIFHLKITRIFCEDKMIMHMVCIQVLR